MRYPSRASMRVPTLLVGLLCAVSRALAVDIHDTDPFVGVSREGRSGLRGGVAGGASAAPLVTITVPQGKIRIHLRPDLAKDSVQYVLSVASQSKCAVSSECKLYRAEKGFLLQGSMRNQIPSNTKLGPCPLEFQDKPHHACPAHDPNCGCHGPIMVPGMVGWAGGGPGPDFFIYAGQGPATHWNNDHTVWGELADAESMRVVEAVLTLPVNRPPHGMAMLDNTLKFELELA